MLTENQIYEFMTTLFIEYIGSHCNRVELICKYLFYSKTYFLMKVKTRYLCYGMVASKMKE